MLVVLQILLRWTYKLMFHESRRESSNIYIYIYIYIYIIAEVERKWIPTIKEVLTNRKIDYLKFRHI